MTQLSDAPDATSDAGGRLRAAWAEAWRPRPAVDRATWCQDHLRLPAETSASPGKFDLRRYAYCRGVLDAADDPNVEMIVLCWATQLGKSTVALAILLSQAILAPAPAMLVQPDKDEMLGARDKLYATAEATKPLAGLLPADRLRNNRWVDVGNMRAWLAYPYNTQRLSGKSAALVVCSEVDRFRARKEQGDPVQLAKERTKAFYRSLIALEGTPTDEESRIWKLYEASDRRRFLVPCPRCNHYQTLRLFPHRSGKYAGCGGIAGLQDKEGKWRPAEEVRSGAHYVCERGCKITDEHKPEMVAAGQWVPRGQSIDRKDKVAGKPERPGRIWGSQLNSLYAEPITFGRYAAEYLEARDDPERLQTFTNTWEARRWKKKPDVPPWRSLHRRLRGTHPRGKVPPGAIFLTAGADPGEDYVRWVVRGWGEGSSSWLVDWGTTRKRVAADGSLSRTSHLDQLDEEIIRRVFALLAANVLGETQLTVRLTGVDCGYKPRLVHQWSRKHPGDRVYTMAGRGMLKGGEFYRCSLIEKDSRTGKPYPGGLKRWEINRHLYNSELHARWKAALDEPGAWWLTEAPLAECEEYLRELVNEAPVKTHNKQGREVIEWQKVEASVGNHSWDAEAMALAAADIVVGGDWDNLAARFAKTGRPRSAVLTRGDSGRRPDGRPWIDR